MLQLHLDVAILITTISNIKKSKPVVRQEGCRDTQRRHTACTPPSQKDHAVPAPLTDQLCYTLYATSMAINRAYKPMLDAMGITYPQYLVLNVLAEEDGGTIGAIAARLALESSTVTPLVKRLERAAFVTRRRSQADERLVQVQLTSAGRDLLLRSGCLGETLIERSGMTRSQVDVLNRQIQALRNALGSSRPPEPGHPSRQGKEPVDQVGPPCPSNEQ